MYRVEKLKDNMSLLWIRVFSDIKVYSFNFNVLPSFQNALGAKIQ